MSDKKRYYQFHKDHGHNTEDCRDLNEQIEELIRKGKLQKYVKKGESSRFSNDNKNQRKSSPKDEDCISQRPSSVIEEIKMIIGPSTSGSFKPLRKACQRQVNNVHKMPLFKQKQTNRDISFSEEDARVVK